MEKTPDASERLATVLQFTGLPSLHSLARRLGLKHAENLYQIRRGNNSISGDLARRINSLYPQFSLLWLVFGIEATPPAPAAQTFSHETTVGILPLYYSLKRLKEQPAFPNRMILLSAELCPRARYAALTDSHECGTIETVLLLCDREGEPDEELGRYRICGSITSHHHLDESQQ